MNNHKLFAIDLVKDVFQVGTVNKNNKIVSHQ